MSPENPKSAARADEFARSARAAKFVLSKTKLRPKVGIVLGTGLGSFADELAAPAAVPYAKIPGFPRSTVDGHSGRLVIGKAESVPVAVMQGRVHLYEGYSVKDVIFPMRVFWQMGIRAVILTNASGAINLDYREGALVMIRDHINLQGTNALVGPNDKRFGPRFPDVTKAYTKEYREIALAEARKLGIAQHEGVYAAMLGPSFETPAEIRFLKAVGADLVGMSTVQEVIAARHMNIRVLGISCATNIAAGILDREL
ncbi:MAG TPA: purine-nucleoside phosphorylase, partial [Candidatus Baltobacteraceae bacterium]|nr:purine-nucleoside phosphorylase [Candidatus Baltobacteraceae bacterium]